MAHGGGGGRHRGRQPPHIAGHACVSAVSASKATAPTTPRPLPPPHCHEAAPLVPPAVGPTKPPEATSHVTVGLLGPFICRMASEMTLCRILTTRRAAPPAHQHRRAARASDAPGSMRSSRRPAFRTDCLSEPGPLSGLAGRWGRYVFGGRSKWDRRTPSADLCVCGLHPRDGAAQRVRQRSRPRAKARAPVPDGGCPGPCANAAERCPPPPPPPRTPLLTGPPPPVQAHRTRLRGGEAAWAIPRTPAQRSPLIPRSGHSGSRGHRHPRASRRSTIKGLSRAEHKQSRALDSPCVRSREIGER